DLWEELGNQIHLYLRSVSIADVVENRVLGTSGVIRPRFGEAQLAESGGAVAAGEGFERPAVRARAHLDYNATAPIRPEAARAVADALLEPGNPSSVHGYGRRSRRLIEDARDAVAALVGAKPAEIIFTSGATEANDLALNGTGRARVI